MLINHPQILDLNSMQNKYKIKTCLLEVSSVYVCTHIHTYIIIIPKIVILGIAGSPWWMEGRGWMPDVD